MHVSMAFVSYEVVGFLREQYLSPEANKQATEYYVKLYTGTLEDAIQYARKHSNQNRFLFPMERSHRDFYQKKVLIGFFSHHILPKNEIYVVFL